MSGTVKAIVDSRKEVGFLILQFPVVWFVLFSSDLAVSQSDNKQCPWWLQQELKVSPVCWRQNVCLVFRGRCFSGVSRYSGPISQMVLKTWKVYSEVSQKNEKLTPASTRNPCVAS